MKTETSAELRSFSSYRTYSGEGHPYNIGDHTDGSDELQQTDPESTTRRATRPAAKPSGACVHCKSLKVRCEPIAGQSTCQRCQAGGFECVARTRKKRKPAPTHEDLQMRALKQDADIQNLLLQFDQLTASNRIRNRMSRTPKDHHVAKFLYPGDGFELLASGNSPTEREVLIYFSKASTINVPRLAPPDIVRFCSLSPTDIVELFDLFFERVNPYFSILDPDYHTAHDLIWTKPFLFTVICSIAARYYTSKPDLFALAQGFAQDAASRAFVEGIKSVDICQAYLLMAVYSPPMKKWEQDRRWIVMGVAIRMAMELELNKQAPSTCSERERLNRTRTWLNCFCVDGSHSIQFGKIPMLDLNDPAAVYSQDWYRSSSLNIPFDVHLCAYVQIIVIMDQWRKQADGNLRKRIREGLDVVNLVVNTEEKLIHEMNIWARRYAEQYRYRPLEICLYRGNTTQLIVAYLRLVVLAVGFQYVARSGLDRDCEVLKRSIDAARSVIHIIIDDLYPTGNLKYAMEANFVYVSFAAAYLVNLLRPKFLPLIEENMQEEIVRVVDRLVNVLGSSGVALDDSHTPALYSRFLKSLMAKHKVHALITQNHASPIAPGVMDPSAALYSWPDVRYSDSPPSANVEIPQPHDMDMDFSLAHFVHTVQSVPKAESGFDASMFTTHSQWPPQIWPTDSDQAYLASAPQWSPSYHEPWRQ